MLIRIWHLLTGRKDLSRNRNTVILVIDDGEVERKFIARVLSRNGFKVITAVDGADGVRMVREHKPHLIFLDFNMPKMNGMEVCKVLKSDSALKNIPVTFLTGSVSPTQVINCYDVGAEYYLTKPISAGMLLEQVKIMLEDEKTALAANRKI